MAADVRVSSEIAHGTYKFNDGSEKLFRAEYTDKKGGSIKIGICTSGFAGGNGITIAGVINQYLKQLMQQQTIVTNYQELLYNFYQYLQSDPYIPQLGDFIFSQTSFGVGMIYGEQSSIGGWKSTQNLNLADNFVDGINGAYLEASFGTYYLNQAHPDIPISFIPTSYDQSTQPHPAYANKSLQQILDIAGTIETGYKTSWPKENESAIEFTTSVISEARHDKKRQTISEPMDIISLEAGKEIFVYQYNKKENALTATFQIPVGFVGSDIHTVPEFHPNTPSPAQPKQQPPQPQHYYPGQGIGVAPPSSAAQSQLSPQGYEPNPGYSFFSLKPPGSY